MKGSWLQTLPLATVSHWLGHASVHITSAHYLHYLADSMERAGLDQLNRSLCADPRDAT